MDQKLLFKQMLDFQKSTFDNSFKAMTTLQEQGEKMVNMFVEQAPWLPKEGKQVVTDWVNAYRKGREEFKKIVESNFEKVQEYFSEKKSE
jgi:polyhydroxyalkanoate synthesis regulator phasin